MSTGLSDFHSRLKKDAEGSVFNKVEELQNVMKVFSLASSAAVLSQTSAI